MYKYETTLKTTPIFRFNIFNVVFGVDVVNFVPERRRFLPVFSVKCKAFKGWNTYNGYGIQEVRGSIPLVSTNSKHAGLRVIADPLFSFFGVMNFFDKLV